MKKAGLACTLMTALALMTHSVHAAGNVNVPKSALSQPLAHFTPRPKNSISIDFDAWDFMLLETVLYMGPSTRTRSPSQTPQTGTRFIREHKSPYRMEGNKVLYSLIDGQVEKDMAAYAEELIELGNTLDIPALPRNEQLAYWINLHNAVLVTTIKDNYPGPHRNPYLIQPIKGSDARLHDAPLIKVNNVALSLRDIRERIVFPNWKNPDVAFAFHGGNLGGPSLANRAYVGSILSEQLKQNSHEYVNSLRAYHKGRVGPYFYDIAPWYFSNFETDLSNYLRNRMRPEVYAEFLETDFKGVNRREEIIADMTGGYGLNAGMERYYGNLESTAKYSKLGVSVRSFLVERSEKTRQLQKQEWFNQGTVTIEDIETDDAPTEVE